MCGRFSVSSVYAIITLYTAELFPTEIRNSAVGFSSTCGHVGSMIAPFVVDLLVSLNRAIKWPYFNWNFSVRVEWPGSFRQPYVVVCYLRRPC